MAGIPKEHRDNPKGASTGAGTYSGEDKQFDSQKEIGKAIFGSAFLISNSKVKEREELASAIATIENDISTFSKAIVADTNLELDPSNIRDAILSVLTMISSYSTTASLLKLYLLSLEGITYLAQYVPPKNFTDLEHYSKEEFYSYLIENLDALWSPYLHDYLVSLL